MPTPDTYKPSVRPLTHNPSKRPAKPKPETARLMKRLRKVIDDSNGEITQEVVAKEIGVVKTVISEWMAMRRSLPNSESTLAILLFVSKHEAKSKK